MAIRCIERVLRPGGVFVGTVPIHVYNIASHGKVVVKLPDDTRPCIEYSAPKDGGFMCIRRLAVGKSFEEYYERTEKKTSFVC